MARKTGQGGWRPPGARNPTAFVVSVAGAVLVLVGLLTDAIALAVVGAALAVGGWLIARRAR
ncbi:hypothetical protein ACGFIH_21320 [Micromonospora parva]|uniref:hypothetical protein n=1 Tax=Micromonospora parva TaxID=1464048 RepID=UPI003718B9F3